MSVFLKSSSAVNVEPGIKTAGEMAAVFGGIDNV